MTGRWWVRLLGLLIVLMAFPTRSALPDDGYRLDLPPALRNAWPAGYDPASARWLPAHQMPDGHWPARGPGESGTPHDLTATGLSLGSFLGAGYNPQGKHPFARVVRRGLGWLRRRQAASGCFARARDPDPLIGHAVATLAMTEAYGMTDSVLLRDSAVPALAHLLSGQAANGAWKQPGTSRDDPLATFWAALPLKSAQLINKSAVQAGRTPPMPTGVEKALARIAAWFGRRMDATTGIVRALDERERSQGATTLVLTAAGALLRVYAGEDPTADKGTLHAALEHLAANPPSADRSKPTGDGLYIYIGTLACFQAGGKVWETWKQALERGVVETQIRKGTAFDLKGSWDPAGAFATTRGRLTMTTLMSLALEVFYRYDKVFGADPMAAPLMATQADLAGARSHALKLEVHASTWKRSTLPVHSARMKLAEGGSLPIDAAHLRAEVHGTRAQVVLDLFVTNPHKAFREGVLDLRLPDGAAPYYLAFGGAELAKVPPPGAGGVVGTDLASLHGASTGTWGAMREARMAPVTKATTAFETIVRQRKDPALLTWSGAGMFHLRVFPLEPGKQHRITVGYEVDLTPVGDDAELRLALPRAVHDLRVAVSAPGATWSTLPEATPVKGVRTWHEPATDVIRIIVAKPGPTFLVGRAADGSQHTAAWIQPELPEIPRVASPRAQFLIDVSQSVGADYVQIWRALVPAILEQNRDQLKSFSVGFFDVRTNWWRDGFVENTPTNVAALRKALDVIEAGGATDVAQALRSARERAEPMDIFLFTDGATTWGDPTTEGIHAEVRADRPVFAYAAGLGERRHLLEDIAERSGGALVHVLGAADIAAAARAHRFEPWTLQALALPGVSDILIAGDPRRIYPGQHLRLAGRGRLEAGGKLFLRLRHGEREVTVRQAIPTPIESPMAARAYGQAGVERLEAAGSGVGRLATDYAIHYRVVRKSAALVMLESKKDYARFGLDKTGHAKRVAARPVLTALAALPPRPTDAAAKFSPLAFARSRDVPEPLVRILRAAPAHRRSPSQTPAAMPANATLRSLSSVLDRGKPTTSELRKLALHIHGLGLPGHAAAALLFATKRDPIADWLMARSAIAAQRPLLALAAYEAALGSERNDVSDEVLWIIAADYERHLVQALAADPPAEVKAFIRARAASLRAWRDRMRVHAPSRKAALVVLHVPYDRRDRASIEVHGSEAITIPQERYDNDLRMTALSTLPKGTWSVRLVRSPSEKKTDHHEGRSLVIVIRDWGHPSERVSFARSIEPEAGGTLLLDSAR